MVLPLLYGIGAKDYLEPRGFMVLTCQRCRATGPFAAFDAKRKVTLYSIPTVSFRDQLVLECRSCLQRFAVPAEMRQQFMEQLLSEEELLTRLKTMGMALNATSGTDSKRTYYQVLQVDPAADPEVIDAAFRRLIDRQHADGGRLQHTGLLAFSAAGAGIGFAPRLAEVADQQRVSAAVGDIPGVGAFHLVADAHAARAENAAVVIEAEARVAQIDLEPRMLVIEPDVIDAE